MRSLPQLLVARPKLSCGVSRRHPLVREAWKILQRETQHLNFFVLCGTRGPSRIRSSSASTEAPAHDWRFRWSQGVCKLSTRGNMCSEVSKHVSSRLLQNRRYHNATRHLYATCFHTDTSVRFDVKLFQTLTAAPEGNFTCRCTKVLPKHFKGKLASQSKRPGASPSPLDPALQTSPNMTRLRLRHHASSGGPCVQVQRSKAVKRTALDDSGTTISLLPSPRHPPARP